MINQIELIDSRVRTQCERLRGDDFPECLEGMCGIASCILMQNLEFAGIHPHIECNDEHAFLVWGIHLIDITATQFGESFGAVIVVNRAEAAKLCHWYWGEEFDTIQDFADWQQEDGDWPEHQCYHSFMKNKDIHVFTED